MSASADGEGADVAELMQRQVKVAAKTVPAHQEMAGIHRHNVKGSRPDIEKSVDKLLTESKASVAEMVVPVDLTTSTNTISHATSAGTMQAQFPPNSEWFDLPAAASSGSHTFQFQVSEPATAVILKTTSGDGWNFDSVLLNGVEVSRGPEWLDEPCTDPSDYAGFSCAGMVELSTIFEIELTTSTNTIRHATSSGTMQAQFPPNSEWFDLPAAASSGSHTFQFQMSQPATAVILKTTSGDGWNFDSVLLNGVEVSRGPEWLDEPCTDPSDYAGFSCAGMVELATTP
jgi:hypothetical protein